MRVLLFGASGMVGRGVLRECLRDAGVSEVLVVGRSATDVVHPKLREHLQPDLFDLEPLGAELARFDACFFCLGVSSAGLPPAEYRRLTFDLTLSVARLLSRRRPGMTFTYVSGAGTDASKHGWAGIKGRTEQALLGLPLRATMFRPGIILPTHGERSKTRAYRLFYALTGPVLPVLRRWLPGAVTTTEHVGRAMLAVARLDQPPRILEAGDLDRY